MIKKYKLTDDFDILFNLTGNLEEQKDNFKDSPFKISPERKTMYIPKGTKIGLEKTIIGSYGMFDYRLYINDSKFSIGLYKEDYYILETIINELKEEK